MANGNTVTVVGNLTRDPELRYTPSGAPNTRFGVAVNRRWMDRNTNEWQEATSFFDIVCWREMAENVSESLAKGSASSSPAASSSAATRTATATGATSSRSSPTRSGQPPLRDRPDHEERPPGRRRLRRRRRQRRRWRPRRRGWGRELPTAPTGGADLGEEPF